MRKTGLSTADVPFSVFWDVGRFFPIGPYAIPEIAQMSRNAQQSKHIAPLHTMYHCEDCNYTCGRKNDYARHTRTPKHLKNVAGEQVDAVGTGAHICDACRFYTDSNKYYLRHIRTARHIKLVGEPEIACPCGDTFTTNRALLFHQKKCDESIAATAAANPPTHQIVVGGDTDTTIKQLMDHIIKQDRQLEIMNETLGNISARPTVTNNILNINIFLSDHCKNAIDIETFIGMLAVDVNDVARLEETHNIQSGVKEVFTRAIDKLSVTERPFQCVDVKRNTMYVNRKHDGWIKDENNESSAEMIDCIIRTYKDRLPDWMRDNPDLAINSHPTQDLFKALVNIIYSERTGYADNQILKYISQKTACTKEMRTKKSIERLPADR